MCINFYRSANFKGHFQLFLKKENNILKNSKFGQKYLTLVKYKLSKHKNEEIFAALSVKLMT